jgi:AcrR family transcriptional regulator
MMHPMTPTRERIVDVSSELFRRQGFSATGVKQIVAEAGAPFGSLYHFFPAGKEQLGAEVIRRSGGLYGQLIAAFFPPGADPVSATRLFFEGAAATLRETDYADACPIATVALEVSSTSEPMREACAEVFDGWIDDAAARLREAGLPRARSRALAISMLASLEGAAQHGAARGGGRRRDRRRSRGDARAADPAQARRKGGGRPTGRAR